MYEARTASRDHLCSFTDATVFNPRRAFSVQVEPGRTAQQSLEAWSLRELASPLILRARDLARHDGLGFTTRQVQSS